MKRAILVATISIYLIGMFVIGTNSFGSTQNQLGYIVPLYMGPGSDWNSLIQLRQSYPSVPIIAIINPNSGPVNPNCPGGTYCPYVAAVAQLQSAGITVLGYVATGYGTISTTTVKSQSSEYKSWFGVNGIFLDEMNYCATSYPQDPSYYTGITIWEHGQGLSPVIGNPGSQSCASYVGTVDVINGYENPGLPSLSGIAADTINLGGSPSGWSIVAYNVNNIPTQNFFSQVSNDLTWIYVTDGPGGNEPGAYASLPSYQTTEVSDMVLPGGTTTTTTGNGCCLGGGSTSTVTITSNSVTTVGSGGGGGVDILGAISNAIHTATSTPQNIYLTFVGIVTMFAVPFVVRED